MNYFDKIGEKHRDKFDDYRLILAKLMLLKG